MEYGHGFHPLARPTPQDMQTLNEVMTGAGWDIAELEMIGGPQAVWCRDVRLPA